MKNITFEWTEYWQGNHRISERLGVAKNTNLSLQILLSSVFLSF
jgi:hypothetical protein